ncbi:MAG: flippase [Nitrospiraceae bacterium]|nr:flippase [Nitrospiraceae bacterium]
MNQTWWSFLRGLVRRRLEGRHDLQKIIGNTAFLFADQIVRMGVGLVVGVWVARYLGPARYGQLNYSVAFVALFSAVAPLGLNDIVVRNIVRDPASKEKVLGTAFVLKLMGGMAAVGLTLIGAIIVRPSDRLTQWLVGIIAVGTIFQAFDAIDYWFQSQVQSKYTVYARNSAFLLLSIVKIFLIIVKAPLIAFAWAGLAEIAVGSLGLIVVYEANGNSLTSWRASLRSAKALLRDSWPLIFSGIVIMIYLRIDQVMLGQMVGDGEVGIYSAAVRLSEVWYFIPMAVVPSFFPSIVEAKDVSDELFYQRLQKLYNMMALVAYLVAVPVTFLSGWVVDILFGPAYRKAGSMLAVLIWAGLFVNLGVARSSFLTTMNWTRIHLMSVFLGSLINVALNFLLIPYYGGMGAAIASCVAYWAAAHGACFVYKPMYKTGWMLTKAMIYPKVW